MNGRIRVANSLLGGIDSSANMPTYLASVEGLSKQRIEQEIRALAHLQAVAPVFRIVALSDRDIFGLVRGLGWPVEHFASPEMSHGYGSRRRLRQYRETRISIMTAHFTNTVMVTPSLSTSLASQVAHSLGLPNLAKLPSLQPSQDSLGTQPTLPTVPADLATGTKGVWESPEGSAVWHVVTGTEDADGAMFINACPSEPLSDGGAPKHCTVIKIEFTSNSTREFEALVYQTIISAHNAHLAVVLPRSMSAALLPNARYWIDLALNLSDGVLVVDDTYNQQYSELHGSPTFDWTVADTYAAVRRVSRALSKFMDS